MQKKATLTVKFFRRPQRCIEKVVFAPDRTFITPGLVKVGVKEWEGSLSYLLLLFHYVSMFSLSRHTIEKLSLFCNLMTYSHGN